MKKIILFTLIFLILLSLNPSGEELYCRETQQGSPKNSNFQFDSFSRGSYYENDNETYYYLLKKANYDVSLIDNRYITGQKLIDMVNIIFDESVEYEFDHFGNVKGKELIDILEGIGLSGDIIEERKLKEERILTFPYVFEIFDWYFDEILERNSLNKEIGVVAFNGDNLLVSYQEGKIKELEREVYPELTSGRKFVEIVTDGEDVIEIIPPAKNVPLMKMYNKKEVLGKLFLMYDGCITIDLKGNLLTYLLTDRFTLLRRSEGAIEDKEIAVITGQYKKNSYLTAIAIEVATERMN